MFTSVFAFSQDKSNLKNLVYSSNQFVQENPAEKIYLHTNQSDYNLNDTLWFKAYILNANYLTPSIKSGILYVEIANDSNFVMKRWMLPVANGISFGQFFLDGNEYPTGRYILRAYTNWMRNFGEATLFQKTFNINNQDWLVAYNSKLEDSTGNKYSVDLNIKKFGSDGIILNDLELSLRDDKRRLQKNKLRTDVTGNVNFTANIPDKVNKQKLVLSIKSLKKGDENKISNFPLLLNSNLDIDLQFMPESGELVNGIKSKIAFKAINSLGLSTSVAGELYEEGNSKKILDFSSSHNGIGYFYLQPSSGKKYYVLLKPSNGAPSKEIFSLPEIKDEGCVLQVDNSLDSDSLLVRISKSKNSPDYCFLAKARDIICYASMPSIAGKQLDFKISKSLFPTGITALLLVNQQKQIVIQRLVYIDHQDNLKIEVSNDKNIYYQRDSVGLTIKVSDKHGKPVSGSFSLAVTDDFFAGNDSLNYQAITTYMNLSSHLKGEIENINYYSDVTNNKIKWQNLDNLLLSQGWVNYAMDKTFAVKRKLNFEAEKEFEIKGKVSNAFNKPIANSDIVLLSKKPFEILETTSDSLGRFVYKNIFPRDSAIFFIQAKNKHNKSFNVGIEVEEFNPPVFTKEFPAEIPWNVYINKNEFLNGKDQLALNNNRNLLLKGNMLKEVSVTAKKMVKDSKNLNGPGEADLVLDEKVIQKEGKATLGDLIRKKIPEITLRYNKTGHGSYSINSQKLHLIIDGVDVEFFKPEGVDLSTYFNDYFNYYDAEDIKGIELMKSPGYVVKYVIEYRNPLDYPIEHAFLEVTTRGGVGPFLKKAVGTYLFKPMAFSLPKQFYSPKYQLSTKVSIADLRSTIFWEPNFITDKDGIAKLSFFTSDHVGNYSIHIEGDDLQGYLGSGKSHILVKKD
ncbi:hypothetical protein ADIARSV_2217 [Arcticibacter svalbardensis MN12-7]|uniref:TonB-dependent receptor plug domain-containing protein n=1 Tax=Arcticibacter svalbardensis MN12-7 TaxID=1150600 RepID=R9H075_9SPHI|nr:hypothetical protein ADIARSV_2217 [Arcticibacter svalbardensis MN12-7]